MFLKKKGNANFSFSMIECRRLRDED